MSKKTLTVLAPVAAIVACMALPALAQATQVQCGAAECATGAVVRLQSTNLATATQNPAGTLSCTGSEFEGTVSSVNGQSAGTVEDLFTKDTLTGCVTNGHTADIKTNASTTAPWKLQVQAPSGGNVVMHLDPAAGSSIALTVQVQEFGFSVATCTFSGSTIQLNNTAQTDTASVTGTNQFTLTARSGIAQAECGTVGTTTLDLTGSFQLETAAGAAVVVH